MNNWTKRWDDRYSTEEFAYGEEPNNYLKEQIEKLNPSTILFPAEGEGRNAIFASKLGWNVSAFDISEEGRNKALKLAEANNVSIDYQVGELETLDFEENQFDAIALIYAHFPAEIKSDIHKQLDALLKKKRHYYFRSFQQKTFRIRKKK